MFKKDEVASKLPKDYYQYWCFSKPPISGYAGVATLSRYAPKRVEFELGIMKHDLEGRLLTLEFERFYLVSCYVPHSSNRLAYRVSEWDVDFRKYLKSLRAKKHVILCGDFNVAHKEIDVHDPKKRTGSMGFTMEERMEFSRLLKVGFVDAYRHLHPKKVKYSEYSTKTSEKRDVTKGSRLDYFLVSTESLPALVSTEIRADVLGSDHCPIELVIDTSCF
jgi:exodeoxyribonuclease III